MLNIESTTPYFEGSENIKEFWDKNRKVIESLLEKTETKIGEGKTAKVHYPEPNQDICLKIIRQQNEILAPFYNSPKKEMDILSELQNIGGPIRVPKPYLSADYSDENRKVNFLLMERLKDSFTIREIMDGVADLPENFDIDAFYSNLKEFVKKMHEKNIYHRDLHDANVMINIKNLETFVIDFGASAMSFGGDDPYKEERIRNTVTFTSDENNIRETFIKLKNYLLTKRQ